MPLGWLLPLSFPSPPLLPSDTLTLFLLTLVLPGRTPLLLPDLVVLTVGCVELQLDSKCILDTI
jgi:hypothetical protein